MYCCPLTQMFSDLPFGGSDFVGPAATSTRSASCRPFGPELGGLRMPGSWMNVSTASTTRMKTTSATTITSQYSVSIESACGDPPDSGENASPNAVPAKASRTRSATAVQNASARRRRVRGGSAKGCGILVTAPRTATRHRRASTALEHGLAALAERRDALREVAGRGHLLLD